MALITYTDKVAMNANANIPAINKCQAADMNEIKSVVNTNADYLVNTGFAVVDETVCTSVSLASGSQTNALTIDISKSGYTPLGIIGYNMTGTNHQGVNIVILDLTASGSGTGTITYRFRNLASSGTASINLTAKVLWAKI